MKSIYIVNCDKMRMLKTFKSYESVFEYLNELNQNKFDGDTFSCFGRPFELDYEGEYIEKPYLIDSVVLCPKNNPNEYYTFFIRCIDGEGNFVELN
jgi:hypothetical protein